MPKCTITFIFARVEGNRRDWITGDLDRWRQGEGILFSSIRAFKGLEADAVILLDVPVTDSNPIFTRTDLYVAASRAKHVLVVLAQSEASVQAFYQDHQSRV